MNYLKEAPLEVLVDTDGDGIKDALDTDDDGDGVLDTADAFPLDKTETLDTDSDGIGNNKDTDDDGDTYLDTEDRYPLVAGTNIAPIFSSEAACSSVTENVYFVCDLTAADADGDTITFSLSGTDAPDFEVLNGTRLAFKAPANYEKPTDYGTNNKYNLTISMNDGYGVAKTIIVAVTNVQENLLGEDGFGQLRAE